MSREEREGRTPPRVLEHDLVVEAQPQLGHPAQVALHLDRAQDLAPHDVAVRVNLCDKREEKVRWVSARSSENREEDEEDEGDAPAG